MGAHIGVQEAAIQSDKHDAAEVLSKAKKDEKKLVVEETEAKDEHKKFAKSAALVVAQATAVTEKHLRQKIETQASAQVAKAESRVAELKARLAAASAAGDAGRKGCWKVVNRESRVKVGSNLQPARCNFNRRRKGCAVHQ